MSTFENLVERKGNLFIISIFAAIGMMLLPVILPNLFHGFHMAHISLHIAGLALAIFLTISTLYAYVKIRTKRLATATIAFSMFIGAEIFSIIEVAWPYTFYLDRITMSEISHMLIIGMLGIFSIGVFKRD
ncbi:hypothetical protein [Candidatus Nitrosotenuis cloacae]|uniref:hypothetical protein n=1 Tax=Candidatus Nitrosotenuis cloacae TaxID=1603555 RepID=UPI0022815DE4|nr:hypothetical protein [Candidatus Nitrosotenuis cloacae]